MIQWNENKMMLKIEIIFLINLYKRNEIFYDREYQNNSIEPFGLSHFTKIFI
jgi:hypothetical protein